MPIPEPKTPKKSATAAINPTVIPPRTVTTGMYRLSTDSMGLKDLLYPGICIPDATSCFAIVEGPSPPTSSQVSENTTQNATMMSVKPSALRGASATWVMFRGPIT